MNLNHFELKFNRSKTSLLCIFLVLALFISALPQSRAAAVTCKFKHKVQQGETLTYISTLYGTDWLKIAEANNLSAPYAISAGQVLCIPEGEKTSTTTTTTKGKEPTLQVVPGLGAVLVSVENFPKKTSYYVRVYPVNRPVSYRIGVFTTNKEGDFTDWFRLPSYILRMPKFSVCVKNVWTDAVSCIKMDDIFASPPYLNTHCKSKKDGK